MNSNNTHITKIPTLWSNLRTNNNINEISIILYSYHLDKILILLGKESNNSYPNKTDLNLISNFRGKLINDESIPQCAGRILFEKTMNMIMEPFDFEQLINENKIKYTINKQTITFIHQLEYIKYENVPEFYSKIFKYLTLCTTSTSMNNWVIDSCPLGFLDKSELYWINMNDIKLKDPTYKKKFLIELYDLVDEIKDNINKESKLINKESKLINKINPPFWFSA